MRRTKDDMPPPLVMLRIKPESQHKPSDQLEASDW